MNTNAPTSFSHLKKKKLMLKYFLVTYSSEDRIGKDLARKSEWVPNAGGSKRTVNFQGNGSSIYSQAVWYRRYYSLKLPPERLSTKLYLSEFSCLINCGHCIWSLWQHELSFLVTVSWTWAAFYLYQTHLNLLFGTHSVLNRDLIFFEGLKSVRSRLHFKKS